MHGGIAKKISGYPGNKKVSQSLAEAMGYAAMFKVARKLRHRDNYMITLEATPKHSVLQLVNSDEIGQPAAMAGWYFGREWLYKLSDEEFRDIIRREPENLWDKVSQLQGATPSTQSFIKELRGI